MRHPRDIIIDGRSLADILEAHRKWRSGEAGGERAYLARTIGNMREIKSAQFEQWPVTWTTAPDGTVVVQIGCQRHSIDLWRKSDPRWIAAMDQDATAWWAKYRNIVLALVDASPATPYGAPVTEGAQ